MGRIEITVEENGNVVIQAIGYSGPACIEATREIEEALGIVTERNRTTEFFARTTTMQRQKIGKIGS